MALLDIHDLQTLAGWAGRLLLAAVFFLGLLTVVSLYQFVSFSPTKSSSKRPWRKLIFRCTALSLLIMFMFQTLPKLVDKQLNKISVSDAALTTQKSIDESTRQFHEELFIVDMHADSLMWLRDVLERNNYGHVDVPRLIEGNVALQGFTIPTAVPAGMNIHQNKRPSIAEDSITLLALAQRWGLQSLTSLAARTLYQTQKLESAVHRSNNTLTLIKTKADLKNYLERRKNSQNKTFTAGYLGIEGLHALDGELANVDVFFHAGVRTVGLTHFFDNELGGSAHGEHKGGLTEFGVQVVKRAEELNMFVDIAHASEATIEDLCKIARRPIISSHTGVRGVCDNPRNLRDKDIQCVAKSGGVLGVAYFKPALCGDEIDSFIKTVRYITDLVGVQHVALGSDFDGAVTTPIDTSQVIVITKALLESGYSKADIYRMMGGNVQELFLNYLPE